MAIDWSNITNLLGMQQQRRALRQNQFQNIADTLYNRKEAERQRGFTAGENEKDRTYLDTPFADGPRSITDEATGQTYTYNTPREWQAAITAQEQGFKRSERVAGQEYATEEREAAQGFQQQMQDNAQAFQMELNDAQDAAALERLQTQLDAQAAAAERTWEQPRDEYESQSVTINGRTYSWTSDQGYELQALKMRQDMLNDQIRLEASLRGTDEDARSRIIEAYNFGKSEVLNPSVINQQTGTWQSMADINPDQLEQQFRDAIALYGLSPDEEETAVRLFNGWIKDIPEAPPGTEGAAGGTSQANGDWWEEFRRTGRIPRDAGEWATEGTAGLANMGAGGAVAAPIVAASRRLFGWIPGFLQSVDQATANIAGTDYPETPTSYPPGIESKERALFNQIVRMLPTADEETQLNLIALGQKLEEESVDVPANPMQLNRFIQDFLNRGGR